MYRKNMLCSVQDESLSLVNNSCLYIWCLIFLLAWLAYPIPLNAQIAFEEKSKTAAIDKVTPTIGASWGDFNADGKPDIWVGNHCKAPSLFINKGDGTFTDIAQNAWQKSTGFEDHGAAWGDFDNDGDDDLFEIVGDTWGGHSGDNNFYVNTGGILANQASQYGVQYPTDGGRTPLWWDWNRDGLLDLVPFNDRKSYESLLFQRQLNSFINISTQAGFTVPLGVTFGQLSDLNLDDQLDLLAYGFNRILVYSRNNEQLLDITSTLGLNRLFSTIQDALVSDLDGDLRPDLYLALGIIKQSDALQTQSTEIQGRLIVSGNEKGISFQTGGTVSFTLSPGHEPTDPDYDLITNDQVYIGKTGQHPISMKFDLAPEQAEGDFSHQSGIDKGIFIGFDPQQKRWRLLLSSPGPFGDKSGIVIQSNQIISDFHAIGFSPFAPVIENKYFVNKASGLVDTTVAAGLDTPSECNSVAAGDFDNDMDLDLYLVCSRTAGNRPNILYENLGHGVFVELPDAAGAAGSDTGAGDSVVIADYDEDGFLDLFVTNGGRFNPPPAGPGANQLFRNLGNSNHWLELDLEGVISNRDGIGAKLLVTAGGVTQLREQNGGMHVYSQNHKRMHVGLGQNTRIETLEVRWPNGIVQTLKNLPVDQVLRLIEPVKPAVAGAPQYQAGLDEGVYLWKQDGVYQLRVSGTETTHYEVKLVSSLPLLMVVPTGLETGVDSWQSGMSGFVLTAQVGGGDAEDGVKFQVTPGSRVLLAVEREGAANPRQLHVGPQGLPLSPAGWIVPVAELGVRPAFVIGDLGLATGTGTTPTVVEARWGGDRWDHRMQVDLLSSEAIRGVTPKYLEPQDQVMLTASGVRVSGWVNTYKDGVDVEVAPETLVGIGYQQDRLLQPRFVKSGTGDLGMPNAYWLPGTQ